MKARKGEAVASEGGEVGIGRRFICQGKTRASCRRSRRRRAVLLRAPRCARTRGTRDCGRPGRGARDPSGRRGMARRRAPRQGCARDRDGLRRGGADPGRRLEHDAGARGGSGVDAGSRGPGGVVRHGGGLRRLRPRWAAHREARRPSDPVRDGATDIETSSRCGKRETSSLKGGGRGSRGLQSSPQGTPRNANSSLRRAATKTGPCNLEAPERRGVSTRSESSGRRRLPRQTCFAALAHRRSGRVHLRRKEARKRGQARRGSRR